MATMSHILTKTVQNLLSMAVAQNLFLKSAVYIDGIAEDDIFHASMHISNTDAV